MQESVKETLTIRAALEAAAALLEKANIEFPRREAYVLLCSILSKDVSYVIAHENYMLEEDHINEFSQAVKKRIAKMPSAYITGVKEFMSLTFKVNKNVLIPRADTEILAEEAISLLSGKDKPCVLDLCCGSGCIGIAIAEYVPQSSVALSDISEEAVDTAKENAEILIGGKRCEFFVSDLFKNIPLFEYDLIVSNPPYISEKEYESLSEEIIMYAPRTALLAGNNGLEFYEKIAENVKSYLKEGGYLLLETGAFQAEDVCSILKKHKFSNIAVLKDLAGFDRVVRAEK